MAKMKFEMQGFTELQEKIVKMGGSIESATEKALLVAAETVTPKLADGIAKHRRTGKTEESLIRDYTVSWKGNRATVRTGFYVHKGGLKAIYINYGTKRGISPDPFMTRAISSSKKPIKEAQQEILSGELRKLGEK